MLIIDKPYYSVLSVLVCDEVGDGEFFSGSITYTLNSVDCELLSTLLIYRDKNISEPPFFSEIVDIIPVWWEFHTTLDGVEELNDFDFELLKESICQV